MSSAQTQVGVLSYMIQSTAATNVSFTASLKKDPSGNGFDSILTNISRQNSGQNSDPKGNIASSKDAKTDNLDTSKKAENVSAKEKEPKNTDNIQKDTKNAKVSEEKAVKTTETDGKEADKELQNAITEDGKKIIQEIAEMADVSEEEIIAVMQMIGITPADLLNPENVIQVVNSLSEENTGVDLIVDSNLYDSLKDILSSVNEMREELVSEYDLSQEDLTDVIATMKEAKAPEEGEEKLFNEILQEVPKENIDKNTVKVEIKTDSGIPKPESIELEPENTISNMQETGTGTSNSSEHREMGSNLFKNQETINPFNQLVQNIVDAVNPETNEVNAYTDRAQMENIVRQITEKITVLAGTDETSMELQLHPASLGNVNILLTSSKDGITAKFTAQNEIVKEAVENQMQTLMQKFDEQGVKVTSVEVTIASHAFEQNLQQDDRGETARDQMEKNKKSLRRINLSEIDEEIEEEMTQAELIAAQMMAYNGNTIDFSA